MLLRNLGPLALLMFLIVIGALMFWLLALLDILRSNFTQGINKLCWLLVVLFVPLIGPIIYFFMGRQQKIKERR